VPTGGYVQRDKQSKLAMRYIAWLIETTGVKYRYAGNGDGEVRIGGYRVDAIDDQNNIVEINGCLWVSSLPNSCSPLIRRERD
jgi:hypothetical protein